MICHSLVLVYIKLMCCCVCVQLKFCASLHWMAITGRWMCLTRTIGSWSVAQLLMWAIGGWVPPIKGMQCLVSAWHVHRIVVCGQTQALSCGFHINIAILGCSLAKLLITVHKMVELQFMAPYHSTLLANCNHACGLVLLHGAQCKNGQWRAESGWWNKRISLP